jgi:hypothetical protein
MEMKLHEPANNMPHVTRKCARNKITRFLYLPLMIPDEPIEESILEIVKRVA